MIYDTEFVSAKYKNTKNEIKITQKPPDTGNRKHLINLICADSLHLMNSRLKSVRIWSFSEPYFPAFGVNTERHGVSLRIQSGCGKIQTRKTSNTDTFHALELSIKVSRGVAETPGNINDKLGNS